MDSPKRQIIMVPDHGLVVKNVIEAVGTDSVQESMVVPFFPTIGQSPHLEQGMDIVHTFRRYFPPGIDLTLPFTRFAIVPISGRQHAESKVASSPRFDSADSGYVSGRRTTGQLHNRCTELSNSILGLGRVSTARPKCVSR
jgi:hypothetical protein